MSADCIRPHWEVLAAAIQAGGFWLLGQRPPQDRRRAGLWEFPGGKIEPGETAAEALARELREELDITVDVGARLATVEHDDEERSITLHLHACTITAGAPRPLFHAAVGWFAASDIRALALCDADRELWRLVERGAGGAEAGPI